MQLVPGKDEPSLLSKTVEVHVSPESLSSQATFSLSSNSLSLDIPDKLPSCAELFVRRMTAEPFENRL